MGLLGLPNLVRSLQKETSRQWQVEGVRYLSGYLLSLLMSSDVMEELRAETPAC